MIDTEELEDTHLCIKCNAKIIGLDEYIAHRKRNCNAINIRTESETTTDTTTITATTTTHLVNTTSLTTRPTTIQSSNLHHQSYDNCPFAEPEAPSSYVNKATHGGKTSKHLSYGYTELHCDLAADEFFSSLQLQSVQSTGLSTGGKTGAVTRQRSQTEHGDEAWLHSHETLEKAVRDMSEAKKHYEGEFKQIKIAQMVTYATSDEDERDDVDDDGDIDFEDDLDDEDYDPREDMGMRLSPPTVPMTHTGGKWKPEHRPNLAVQQITRLSPNWYEHADDMDNTAQHPPAEHTKGKWIPGSKVQHLEYRENVDLTQKNYWCNICCRKLKSRANYEQHLRTNYHLKRAEPEQHLEKATFEPIRTRSTPLKPFIGVVMRSSKKRRRRTAYFKCDICKLVTPRHLIGKHLISHYHYRRMQIVGECGGTELGLNMILEHMHAIVRQSPFQCAPCAFYANTEPNFLEHWLSREHSQCVAAYEGRYYCSYCAFECMENAQMYQHLLSAEHKEILRAVNRSVPISISKRRNIVCSICAQIFRFNFELRQHVEQFHKDKITAGSASDTYQSRFLCNICGDSQRSRVALQRHEKFKHSVAKYHCSVCKLEFTTALKARRHRKTMEHKRKAIENKQKINKKERIISTLVKEEVSPDITPQWTPTTTTTTTAIDARAEILQALELKPTTDDPTVEKLLHEVLLQDNAIAIEQTNEQNLMEIDIEEETGAPAAPTAAAAPISPNAATTIIDLTENAQLKTSNIHECMLCNSCFQSAQALGRHTRSCQPIASTSANAQAATTMTQDAAWQCTECSFKANYESDLIYHRLLHQYGPLRRDHLLQCPLCTKSFRKHSLRCHLRKHTNEKIYECDQCQMRFVRRSNLKNHINVVHNRNNDQKCTDQKSLEVKQMKKKKIKKQEEKSFSCDICDKKLASKFNLKLHMLLHTQSGRQFCCTYENCEYAASTKSILNIHLASHSQQSYKCDVENCIYIGRSKLHLGRHKKLHEAARPMIYSCNQCDFKANVLSHLTRHALRHTGEKPHKCPYCDYRCSAFDNLRKHILKTGKHPGKFIYECKFCIKNNEQNLYKTNSYLEYGRHLENKHGTTN